jgi:hypothetical protein
MAHERDVWTLEGRLVAEADAALRTPEARQALGDPAAAARTASIEPAARAFLRERRGEDTRRLGALAVAGLDAPTRELLDEAAARAGVTREDVFLDYLTYDGLFDLAVMRWGWKRWRAGRITGPGQELAATFFANVGEAPAAARGITVVAADERTIELDVFGARVVERVTAVAGDERAGVVTWTSNYQRLRAILRGQPDAAQAEERLELRGTYRVDYRLELHEYLAQGDGLPWATLLYLLPADDVADLYAGVAAGGGLEAGSSLAGRDPAALPAAGTIGSAERGLGARVVGVSARASLGETLPRRGRFLLVTVELRSTLAEELRAPAEWFTLATPDAEYPEVGVAWPGLALVVLPAATPGAELLALPYTRLAPGKKRTLVLVFDVPADVTRAALVLGADELALAVAVE